MMLMKFAEGKVVYSIGTKVSTGTRIRRQQVRVLTFAPILYTPLFWQGNWQLPKDVAILRVN
jgi:hypothetical protein